MTDTDLEPESVTSSTVKFQDRLGTQRVHAVRVTRSGGATNTTPRHWHALSQLIKVREATGY